MNEPSPTPARPRPSIMVVDDDEIDVALIRRAFSLTKPARDVIFAANGEQALQHLARCGSKCLPALILLDINLPGQNGRDTLKSIKANPAWKAIPVAMFTNSSRDQDVSECYGAGANCYIEKPIDFHGLTDVIETIQRFWMGVATLPFRAAS